ncbi:MAG: hypothetical protein WDW38_008001 [Sanguina aurantia]
MQGSRGHACNSQHDATNSKYARPTLSHTQRLLCLPQEEWDEDEISETSMEDSNGAENFTTSKRQLLVSRTHKARLQEAETQGNTIPERFPQKPMFELTAGSNLWYQAFRIGESANELKLQITKPEPESPPRLSDKLQVANASSSGGHATAASCAVNNTGSTNAGAHSVPGAHATHPPSRGGSESQVCVPVAAAAAASGSRSQHGKPVKDVVEWVRKTSSRIWPGSLKESGGSLTLCEQQAIPSPELQ